MLRARVGTSLYIELKGDLASFIVYTSRISPIVCSFAALCGLLWRQFHCVRLLSAAVQPLHLIMGR